jgi:hypothetical protein
MESILAAYWKTSSRAAISSRNAEGTIEASGKVESRVLTDDAKFCEQGFAIFHDSKRKSSCSAMIL